MNVHNFCTMFVEVLKFVMYVKNPRFLFDFRCSNGSDMKHILSEGFKSHA